MSDNNGIHEPQIIKDAKNAAAYYGVLTFVILGFTFIFGGLISPFFLPYLFKMYKEQGEKIVILVGVIIWFTVSLLFLLFALSEG